MSDKLTECLESGIINADNISFDLVRKELKRDIGVKHELDYGRAVLTSQDQLDQYWYTYAPMIQKQWCEVFKELKSLPRGEMEIIDYGCGQGLASFLFIQKMSHLQKLRVKNVTLIEPSLIALNRAEKLLRCPVPHAELRIINKYLDEVALNELDFSQDRVKLHLFSNILDVDGFDEFELFSKILCSKGAHIFLAVSPYRKDHNGGSEKLSDIYNALVDVKHHEKLKIHKQKEEEFYQMNSNGDKKKQVFFIVNLDANSDEKIEFSLDYF